MKIDSLISAADVASRCQELANEINSFYAPLVTNERPLMIVGVLSGSFIFLADLVRSLNIPLEIHWVKVSSYQGDTSQGKLLWQMNVTDKVKDHHLLIVEDIIDTGLTLFEVVNDFKTRLTPTSLKIASLLHKKVKTQYPISADYLGFEIPDAFVVGLGLDYNSRYRELPFIGVLSPN